MKNQTLENVNLRLYVLSVLGDLVALVILWQWRDKSRFRKVRPFTLHVLLAVALNTQNVAAFLAYATPIPCAVIVVGYTLALSSYGVICTERALCILMEVTYCRLAGMRMQLFMMKPHRYQHQLLQLDHPHLAV